MQKQKLQIKEYKKQLNAKGLTEVEVKMVLKKRYPEHFESELEKIREQQNLLWGYNAEVTAYINKSNEEKPFRPKYDINQTSLGRFV